MDPVLLGSIFAGLGGLAALVIDRLQSNRSVAITAAEKAVTTMSATLDAQVDQGKELSRRLTNSETQIVNLNAKVEEIDSRHVVAILHIAERETALIQEFPISRPPWVPVVPTLIAGEVDAAIKQS